MKVLITGGTGYIGSHTAIEIANAGHEVVVVDDFSNSSPKVVEIIKSLTDNPISFEEANIKDQKKINGIFEEHNPEAVIHFAAFKVIEESIRKPLDYYENNVIGSLSLLKAMEDYNVKNFVFSSSASVYGDPESVPVTEFSPTKSRHPYGNTKLVIELFLKQLHLADPKWSICVLRYFNPVGAHKSGNLGEDPQGQPSNLFPFIGKVATGQYKEVKVYGDDYPTKDGTGIRDYIHVSDLASGHLLPLENLSQKPSFNIYNLGTGKGHSVLEVIKAFEDACQKKIPYRIVRRRDGDISECYADPTKAKQELGWDAKLDLKEMCQDTWNWQSKNPDGF